jgi:hypothetical protein
MKLKYLSSILVFAVSSAAFAQSGAEKFVSNYAKLPKSYDSVQFRGQAVGEDFGCQLSMSGGYLNDGMKYISLANDLGEVLFLSIDSTKAYPGNVIELSQGDEEVDEFGRYPVRYVLKVTVDEDGKPLRADGKIKRGILYRDTKISCVGLK